MGVTAALIIAAGSAVSAGASAYGASEAGDAAAEAGRASAGQYREDGFNAAKKLDKYKKLLALPGLANLQAIKANLSNMPDIERITGRVNRYNQTELDRMLGERLPGFKQILGRALGNTASWIRGEIPNDVAAQIKNRSAEKALNFGFAGSASGKALTARDLGTTSMNLMKDGENSLQRWLSTARTYLMPQPFDPTAFFVTPDQQYRGTSAAASIAEKQADIFLGNTGKANEAETGGALANAAGQRQMYQAIGKGVEGVAGAYAGGIADTGGGYQNYLNSDPSASGWRGSLADTATRRSY